MKRAVLLVSFGTSYKEAREKSLDCICNDLAETFKGISVYQAYTSSIIIKKLAKSDIKIYNVDEAVNAALKEKVQCLYVVSTHIIPGHEYNKLLDMLEKYKTEFKSLKIAKPLLYEKADCDKTVSILNKIFMFNKNYEYVLMGHGTDADANIRYEEMNEAFENAGFKNVHIASVEAKPDINDVIAEMKKCKHIEKVIVHPFMIVAGDHANNDMAGDSESYVSILNEYGYNTEAIVKGLGEYPEFRQIYVNKLTEVIE